MSETKKEWKLPKNTRQVGDDIGEKKLYIEDYVVTYLNQLADQKECARALLLGSIKEENLYPYIFVDAAIEVDEFRMDDVQKEEIRKKTESTFGVKEIVGWFVSSKEAPVQYNQELLDVYKQVFFKENQVLMTADPSEEELLAFFLEDEILTEQAGYMIYYEKNIPMQNLLIERKQGNPQEKVEDDAIHRFRKIIKIKKKEKEEEKAEKNGWLNYIASGFLAMTVLALGVTIIYSYDRMKQVEQSLATLTSHVDSQIEYVTDQTESAEAVAAQIKEKGETEQEESLVVEEEELTGTAIQKTAETESEIMTETKTDTETERKTEPEDAVRTANNAGARASYTVKVGDTLAGISEMYYGTLERVQEICDLNGISDQDTILPGQKILLP